MVFKNRAQAGELLADCLSELKGSKGLVLAIPRGGLPLGAVIAKKLRWPLDVVLTKKIGHPFNKEYAIGAVSLKSRVLSEAAAAVDKSYIEEETRRLRAVLEKREREYHQHSKAVDMKNKRIILVDDGIATGNTMLATVDLIHKEGASEIFIATPVAANSAIDRLERSPYVDRVICLSQPDYFQAVGQFYEDFEQVSDEEARSYLESVRNQARGIPDS
jgi:predicted phosphoribosyltransferase